ncbi:tetraacyldisaccharide 4'-kinase [Winogradskyella sp. 3972H.M.0a.05]|uniref:tetraacyldisaccharide 4'-kinase n=1 Tax=Winogradskyella sp. 3972H.M.0a.05 TaxID=2950277 RepID=UPI003390C105
MKLLRYLLLPVVPIYRFVAMVRNWFFDLGVLKSKSYNFPVICIGNLSTGGTGKTPVTEYLIRLLKDDRRLATLSRGYGRSTKGFIQANSKSTAESLGDEPFQFYSKYNEDIIVAVDEKRVNGIDTLKSKNSDLDLVLLDDAFQHRYVKAGFNILLTPYDKLYVNDICLPTGNLREPISGAKRADVIIVTKCPEDLSEDLQVKIERLLSPESHQVVYFSHIDYANEVISSNTTRGLNSMNGVKFTLVTGIADPSPLVSHLKSLGLDFEHQSFKDHHKFSEDEITALKKKELVLTTEKDYMRLSPYFKDEDTLFYLPIEVKLNNKDAFEDKVKDFIKTY